MRTLQRLTLFLTDLALAVGCYLLAFPIRVDPSVLPAYYDVMLRTFPVVLGASAVAFWVSGLYRSLTRYASLSTLASVAQAVLGSVLLSVLLIFLLFRATNIPRSVFIIQGMLLLITMGGIRVLPRLRRYPFTVPFLTKRDTPEAALVYGAGDAGELVVRDMMAHGGFPFFPVGLIDDNRGKVGRTVHGRPVLGTGEELAAIVERTGAHQILIAIPSLRGTRLREMVERCRAVPGVSVKILPGIPDLIEGKVTVQEFHEIRIEDLLQRAPRDLDPDRIRRFLAEKRVMVTGAGGSIGSELCRQIASAAPEILVLFEQSEFALYRITTELEDTFQGMDVRPVLGDASHLNSVEPVIRRERPDLVFHAAAYKHVPLVEANPCEGILNNVLGVVNTANAASRLGADTFVFVSTDKAVGPTNVMGAAKRLGEIYVQAMAARSDTRFTVVRFGNVLGSSGSVIPRFTDQILRGGPVTVTHPEITRYFMLTSEAVGLTLQAATLGRSGNIFVLDMGEPVKIVELAREMGRLLGYEGEAEGDLEVVFTGLRPGEKLHEELVRVPTEERPEGFESLILEGFRSDLSWEELEVGIGSLVVAARGGDRETTLEVLRALVPEYEPMASGNPA